MVVIRGKAEALIQVLNRSATIWTESQFYPSIMDSFTVKKEVARCIWLSMTSMILVPAQVLDLLCLNCRTSRIRPRLWAQLLGFFDTKFG